MMGVQDYVNIGMSYLQIGLAFIREWISKIIGFTGLDGALWTMVLMLVVSLLLARLICKRFVTKPLGGMYFIPTIIITLLIFVILMYL